MTDGPAVTSIPARGDARSQRRPAAGDSVLARVARAPALWLTIVVCLSTAVRAAIVAGVPSPWILPDELVYSEVAKSIAAGQFPAVRGVHELGWGVVYQALVAPAWAIFGDALEAYRAALTINAFVMSLAALPAYFLARMFVGRSASVVVATTTVLVPSMAYTGVLMTENACYPAFLLSVLLIARAVRSPSRVNQAFALVGLGVVALTRIQATALVGAYLAAVVVYVYLGPASERRAYLRRFIPTAVISVVVSFAPMTASIARGDGATGWLGSRSGTFDEFHAHEIPQWFIFLARGPHAVRRGNSRRRDGDRARSRPLTRVVRASPPVRRGRAAHGPRGPCLRRVRQRLARRRRDREPQRAIRLLCRPASVRRLGGLDPQGLPRPRPWAALTVGLCCLLPALLPIGRLGYNAAFQSVGLLPWLRVDASYAVVAALVTGFTLACGALWLTCRRDRVGYLWLAVGVWMSFVGMITVISNNGSATNSAFAFQGRDADWLDRALPDGASAAVIWRRGPETRPLPVEFWLMVTEFFNRDFGDVYRIGRPTYYETFLPTVEVHPASKDSLATANGRRIAPRYVIVTCRTPVVGRVVARAPDARFALVEARQPLQLLREGCAYPP